MVSFLVFNSMSYGQDQVQVGIQSNVTSYDELPEEYRKNVSRAQYEKMIAALPTKSKVLEKVEARKAKERLIGSSIRNLGQAISTFELLSKHKVLAEDLSILDSQFEQFASLRAEFETKKNDLLEDGFGEKEIAKLERVYAKKIAQLLMPFQLEEIGRWRLAQSGIPKILTETQIGIAIGLSDQQKHRIRKESQELADEIEEFLRQKRKEAIDLPLGVLSQKQVQSLNQIFSEKEIEKMSRIPIEKILKHLDYQDD